MSRCRVAIELELEGTDDDAFRVVDHLLDVGVVQDAIHEAATDLGVRLRVLSAVSVLVANQKPRPARPRRAGQGT